MWAAFRILRLTLKSLSRIATALEELRDLYRLELSSRGVMQSNPALHDPVEVQYGAIYSEEEL